MVVVWTGLIALVVWAISRLFPQRSALPPPPTDTDLVVRSRFALIAETVHDHDESDTGRRL
jgi:hypothetical protein